MEHGNRTWCHLFDDQLDREALHAFAARIGLKRCWFQVRRGGLPHYDLTGSKIAAAIEAGAEYVGRERTVAAIRKAREKS